MNEEYKRLCQVFTPFETANEMLEWCKYEGDLYGKKVLENSCGDGRILIPIIKRYIKSCLKCGRNTQEIKDGLNRDIYAFEIDEKHFHKCKENLNKVLNENKIDAIEWENIKQEDALLNDEKEKFDFIFGNPPYIKYKSLTQKDREFIKEKYFVCKSGKPDYCYAFIESSIKLLKNNGKMAYLIPNSIFKNVFAERLRNYILPHILEIHDYTTKQLFKENIVGEKELRLTSSAIMIIEKNSNTKEIKYHDIVKNKTISISKEKLEKKWVFVKVNKKKTNANRFGDYFKASNTIATLLNKAYVINEKNIIKEDNGFIYLKDNYKIEKEVIKNTSSPRSLRSEVSERIIFPYYYKNGNLMKYTVEEFEAKFPNTCCYLNKYKDELNERKSDENTKWFEYGRSQALENANKEKMLLSTVITKQVTPYILSTDNVPYSGIYIQPIKDRSLEEAKEILEDKEFLKYVEKIGIHASGESFRITCKDINDYEFK